MTNEDITARLERGIEKIFLEADITPKNVANFINNDIRGFCNKHKIEITDIPIQYCTILLALKKIRKLTSKQVQEALKEYIDNASN